MNSRQRILASFLLEEPDTVPVSTFMSPYWLDNNWVDERTFWRFAEKSDAIFRVGMKVGGIWLSEGPQMKVATKSWVEDGRNLTLRRVKTPLGALQSISESLRYARRTLEPFIKTDDDVKKWLSIPYVPVSPDPSEYFWWDKKLGDRGLACLSLQDPVSYATELFSHEGLLSHCIKDLSLVQRLLNAMIDRLTDLLTALLEKGVERFWISGPEHVCPPFLHPRYFDALVVKCDRELVKQIHAYGGIVYMHCHGSVAKILPKFKEIGIDVLDTLDPPPQGDADLAEAKRIIGAKICLAGNVDSANVMARGKPKTVERAVKKCIEDAAAGGGYILQPTSGSIFDTPLQNIEAFIKAGRKHGKYGLRG